ncbi:MAG TPA: hypothetical protein VH165_05685 [Kofleriaceae bacterium]|jgi:hypothetical protein|nr:hypothetical protein [Kofleriaceae bacterium]
MQPCSGCGVALAQADILYTTDAQIVCAACSAKADLVETDKRAANTIRSTGFASFGFAIASFVFNPFLLCTILSVVSAFYALGSFWNPNDQRYTKHISRGARFWVMTAAAVALLLDVLVALQLLRVMFLISTHVR